MPMTSRFSRAINCGCAALVSMTALADMARAGSAEDTTTGPDLPPTISDANSGGVQVAAYEEGGAQLLQPPAVDTGRPDLFAKPGSGDEGLPIGNWLVFPTSFAGVAFATNPGDNPTGGRASPGLLVRSNTTAETDDGIKKTVLYSNSDVQYYLQNPGSGGTSANYMNTHTGIIETYQPSLGLIINGQGDFTRQTDYGGRHRANGQSAALQSALRLGVDPRKFCGYVRHPQQLPRRPNI